LKIPINFKKILPTVTKYITNDTPVISADERSHQGLIVPELIKKYGDLNLNPFKRNSVSIRKVLPILKEMKISYKSLPKNPNLHKKTIDETTLNNLRDYARTMGVEDIKFTEVDPSMIFAGKKILFKRAIVLTYRMEKEIMKLAPSGESNDEVFRTYYELGKIVNRVAGFLRSHGFNAQAGPALGGDVNYPWLAQKAGIGAVGKHGLLITPNLGPSLRIAAVYTDIENLPVTEMNDHLWIRDFCDSCNKCVRKCPAGAIYAEIKIFPDNTKQCIDYKKCAVPFSRNHGCSVCIKECLFFSQDYFKIKASFEVK